MKKFLKTASSQLFFTADLNPQVHSLLSSTIPLNPALDPLDKTANLFSQQVLVVLRVRLPHSCLNCCPCNETSQLVAMRPSLSQQLWCASWGRTCSNVPENSSRARFRSASSALSARPLLSFLGSETKLSRRRLSSSRVSATTSGSVCRPTLLRNGQQRSEYSAITQTPLRQEQDRGREAVRECTPSSICKEVLHCRIHCTTLVGRSDRSSTVHSYIPDTHSSGTFR